MHKQKVMFQENRSRLQRWLQTQPLARLVVARKQLLAAPQIAVVLAVIVVGALVATLAGHQIAQVVATQAVTQQLLATLLHVAIQNQEEAVDVERFAIVVADNRKW